MKRPFRQLSAPLLIGLILVIFNLSACKANREEKPVIPPVTSPLTSEYIGFGVITDSFPHLLEDPAEDSRDLGYLRRGSLVRIIRRQIIKTNDEFVSWVLTDGEQEEMENGVQGWLKESVMEIYDNESKARTASESILKQ